MKKLIFKHGFVPNPDGVFLFVMLAAGFDNDSFVFVIFNYELAWRLMEDKENGSCR